MLFFLALALSVAGNALLIAATVQIGRETQRLRSLSVPRPGSPDYAEAMRHFDAAYRLSRVRADRATTRGSLGFVLGFLGLLTFIFAL